jgi:hypothetical protein
LGGTLQLPLTFSNFLLCISLSLLTKRSLPIYRSLKREKVNIQKVLGTSEGEKEQRAIPFTLQNTTE